VRATHAEERAVSSKPEPGVGAARAPASSPESEIIAYCLRGVALVGFGLCALVELLVCYPVAWWLYAALIPFFALGMLRPVSWRAQLRALAGLSLAIVAMAVLYFVPWSTRKPFVRRLQSIPTGATEGEARRIMGKYRVLTEVHSDDPPPTIPVPDPSQTPTGPPTVCDVTTLDGGLYASNELPLGHERLSYRHSCDGDFDADFGVVELTNDQVTEVSFDPD
jgi:hypothetical protein